MGCIFSDMYSFLFTCRESTEIPFDPSIVSLAHFEIQRVLGKGGFGKVLFLYLLYFLQRSTL